MKVKKKYIVRTKNQYRDDIYGTARGWEFNKQYRTFAVSGSSSSSSLMGDLGTWLENWSISSFIILTSTNCLDHRADRKNKFMLWGKNGDFGDNGKATLGRPLSVKKAACKVTRHTVAY
jgi:hypothetical protein